MSNGFSNPPFQLFPDEEIIFKTRPHWLFLAGPITVLLAFWLFYLLYACPTAYISDFKSLCFTLSGFTFPLVILVVFLDWYFDRFYLTNFRVIKSAGFFGQKHLSIFLEQIENITAQYSIWGQLFNYGTLTIESAATSSKLTALNVPRPLLKKWLIENARRN
jgi:uncharacterized membrane protein YdbT with pleckstrin-like domain